MVPAWTWTSSGRSPVRVPGERHEVRLLLLVLRDGCGASFWTTLLLGGYEAAAVSG